MTTEIDFYDAAPDEQVRRLAGLAEVALPQWGLEGAEVTQVAYRENMTFRVDGGDRGVFALRIHQGNYRTDAQIQSELDLMTYLEREGIRTPSVVPTQSGSLFTTVSADGVTEPRQCDVFKWIDGKPLRTTGQPIGEIAPPGFHRPAWDAEGICGVNGVLGDFRRLEGATDAQMRLMLDVSDKLTDVLADFGQSADRYGLSHGDFFAENIFVCEDGIRLLDFDDAGDSWYLFDIVTALFDLLGTPAYDPCFAAIVSGYREHRDLPDDHITMMPAFFLGRLLSYLGWCAKSPHMPLSSFFKPLLLARVEEHAPAFLAT
jgi:Ser/Thr protein kinase RdoA (MazF antagonist)